MNVVPFIRCRFTPHDVATFYAIALPRLQRGLWSGVTRETDKDADRLMATIGESGHPTFMFHRDKSGYYCLYLLDNEGWHIIGGGENAHECLSIWLAPSRSVDSKPIAEEG